MTSNTEIVEGNKLIAGFTGEWEYRKPDLSRAYKGDHYLHKDRQYILNDFELKYHSSWDWLMPVIEKIEDTHDDFHGYFGVHISSNSCTIQGTRLNTSVEKFHPAYLSDPNAIFKTKIESTWYNVVQFIKWYNQGKEDERSVANADQSELQKPEQ